MLSLHSITKLFGPTTALDAADFDLRAGEVHALLGENGAGKSTLMHVAYGMVHPDGGRMTVNGQPVLPRSARDAQRLGLGMVHQHFTSVPALTVAENVALAASWPVRPAANARRVRELSARFGLPLDPAARAEDLPVVQLQRLKILKALAPGAKALLLDEPTGALAPPEVDDLLRVMRAFVAEGGAVVFITHKLREALAVADRITVLRHGRVAWHGAASEATEASLASAMLGDGGGAAPAEAPPPLEEHPLWVPRSRRAASTPVLHLRAASSRRLLPTDLELHAGELVGVAAVEGNGQLELLRLAAGALEPEVGTVERLGHAELVPGNRTTEALAPGFTLTENLALSLAGTPEWSRRGVLHWRAGRAATERLIDQHGIAAAGPSAAASSLSGGNQQKLVLARALARAPSLLVAEHPTRGLDLRAAAATHEALRQAAGQGLAVLFHSADLDEVLALATRVLVVAGGHVLEAPSGATRVELGRLMLGAQP